MMVDMAVWVFMLVQWRVLYVCMHACMCVCMCLSVCVCMYVCMCVCVFTYLMLRWTCLKHRVKHIRDMNHTCNMFMYICVYYICSCTKSICEMNHICNILWLLYIYIYMHIYIKHSRTFICGRHRARCRAGLWCTPWRLWPPRRRTLEFFDSMHRRPPNVFAFSSRRLSFVLTSVKWGQKHFWIIWFCLVSIQTNKFCVSWYRFVRIENCKFDAI